MTFKQWSAPEFRLREVDIALWNAAMSLSGRLVPFVNGKTGFTFKPLEEAPIQGLLRKVVLSEKDFCYAGVCTFPFLSHYGVDLKVDDLSEMPRELSASLRDGMLTMVLSALPKKIWRKIELGPEINAANLRAQLDPRSLQWFSSTLHGLSEDPIELVLGAEPRLICSEIADLKISAEQVQSGLRDLFRVRAERLLGTAALTLPEISGLEPGDCILFTETGPRAKRAVSVNDQVFVFEPQEAGWECVEQVPYDDLFQTDRVSNLEMEDSTMPLSLPTGEEEQQKVSSKALQLNVSFLAGSTTLPISEIESWNVGSVVALPEEVSIDDTQITVRANGLEVAEGSLVQIDGRLAVRINRILLNSPLDNG